MNRKELSELLGVDYKTLTNWEKNRPELVRLINQGLALDEQIEETRKHLERLEEIKAKASAGKFILKK